MKYADFYEFHLPALLHDEARHNIILSILDRGKKDLDALAGFWSLDVPGACALQQVGYGLVLGDVRDRDQAEALARGVRDHALPSVMGADQTAQWLVAALAGYGLKFPVLRAQTIHVISERPAPHSTPGAVRACTPDDIDLVCDWIDAFQSEALPDGGVQPTRSDNLRRIEDRRLYLWCLDERPVSLCGIGRIGTQGAAIAPVYTPPHERCNNYAQAVTSAVVDQILDRDFTFVYLYTDDINPASNRCYWKIGFRPHCRSSHFRKSIAGT